MTHNDRIGSADTAKGIILLIIIALTDYYPGFLQLWFSNGPLPSAINIIGAFSLTAFFFLSGITIPLFLTQKIYNGNSTHEIIRMIFARALILVTAGVLLANIPRVDAGLTGLSRPLWTIMLVAAIFLVWNRYPDRENNFFTVSGLRITGLAILVFLVFKFNSGSYENNGSLVPGCWELPGLLGWGFLVTALVWLALRNSITGTLFAWLFFLSLNFISALGLNDFLDPVRKYFGVLIDGFIPSIVLSGHLAGVLLKRHPQAEHKKTAMLIAGGGIILVAAGILTGRILPEPGSFNNPAWALSGMGAASLLFIMLYWLIDIRKSDLRSGFLESAGAGFFTAYLIYFLITGLIDLSGLNILIYKTSASPLIKAGGSAVFSLIVVLIGNLSGRAGVRLKFS